VGLLRQPPGVAPIFPPAIYVSAFELLMKGAFAEGIAQCRRAIEMDTLLEAPGGGADSLAAGAAARRSGDLPTALRGLWLAGGKHCDRSEAHRILGTAFRLDEQFEPSIQQYQSAIRARPTDERARLALADVLIAADRSPEAEEVLKEAIRIVPGTLQSHYR